jgi:alpha-ketoglutarate-dependent taurine dioxygenase
MTAGGQMNPAADPQGGLSLAALSPVLGAAIRDVDIGHADIGRHVPTIRAAFSRHHLLVFPGQTLTQGQIEAFGRQFGEVETHIAQRADGSVLSAVHEVANLDADGRPTANPYIKANYHWHSDKSYTAYPSFLTMLYAVELPPSGGDTQFANMALAYAALSPDMQRRIADLRVEHSFEHAMVKVVGQALSEEVKQKAPPAVHPLVDTHPETGEKCLYIGMYAARVLDMAAAEGAALLRELLAHATRPEFVYRHTWRPGDFIMWDNRCLMHRAIANYQITAQRRILHRCVVKGSEPYVGARHRV